MIKAAVAAAALPVIVIYVMVAKPDYVIMNSMSHVVLPVARGLGDVVSWPVRVVGYGISGLRDISGLRVENEELRARLAAALARQNECDVAIHESQKLARELDVVSTNSHNVIIADVIHENGAIAHNTFFVNRGTADGIAMGQVVVSMDERLVGIIVDVTRRNARVRTLIDSDTNIAVRIAGSEVYGFLRGNGSGVPTLGFFSDPEFQPARDIKLITSAISGILPSGIFVGTMKNDTDVDVISPRGISRVMILQFDDGNEYR
ncbi:MAG: rod shape-determining protein MreC [Alphaproteobacteria bacterium]|nr:rod shape-determining protein MreC [Alphaproteobacteria bacterium]